MDELNFLISERQVCQIYFIFFPAFNGGNFVDIISYTVYIVFNFVVLNACDYNREIFSYIIFIFSKDFKDKSLIVNVY